MHGPFPRGGGAVTTIGSGLALAALLAGAAGAAAQTATGDEGVPVDRWLVAGPFPADSGEDPLARDRLGGEAGALPERGGTAGEASWRLLREDSAAAFVLDAPGGAAPPAPRSAYAHAYVRTPADRSLRLVARSPACGALSLRLNGQPLAAAPRRADTVSVRLGAGWNTLLAEAAAGDCPLELAVRLLPGGDGLEGVRAQASRPPGDARSLPAEWVEVAGELEVEAPLGWRGDELLGTLRVPLVAWGAGVLDSVAVRVRIGGAERRATASGLQPASATGIAVGLGVTEIRRAALESGGVRLELRWGRRKSELAATIAPASVLRAVHAPIRLEGWGGGGPGSGEPALPRAGEARGGSWQVPRELAGFALRLETDGAPGSYRVGDRPDAASEGEPVVLCDPCRAGQTVTVHATAAAAWTAYPAARVAGPGWLAAAGVPGAPPAVEWLRALGERDNAGYLELAARHAAGPGGS